VFALSLLSSLLCLPTSAQVWPSQVDFVRPGLDWYTIETDHFLVHFHADTLGAGSSRSAQVVARIAEEVYGPITALYDHEPDTKVSIVLIDYEDYSNGAAYFLDNKIDIWAPALDTPLRGAHGWLRNVITHEFTHIVQVQKTLKNTRRRPLYYLQYLDYEDTRRPDVLYGYPNAIATYPVPVLNNPAWLAEGTAQYQRAGLGYDRWDTHRDMLLRTQLLAGEGFSLAEMGNFASKTSLQREQVYNHGFAFTHFLANTYGEDVLRTLSHELSRWSNYTVERALTDALGEPASVVFGRWQDSLTVAYERRTAAVRANPVEGETVEPEGFTNLYPAFSPDGTKLAYVSNKGQDFNVLSLYVLDLTSGEESAFHLDGLAEEVGGHACALGAPLVGGVSGQFAWTPDGRAIVYAKVADNPRGRRFSDLYRVDLETKDRERLTHDRRAAAPAVSPDGTRLVFVQQGDGSANLMAMDLTADDPEATIRPLTVYDDGTQVSDPAWHPSGAWIYFARSRDAGRGLYRLAADGGEAEVVRDDPEVDERSPAFSADGETLYFASDASGIYNLYRTPLGGEPEAVTNVLGGAFTPTVSPTTGAVAFARFQHDGYKIARLDAPAPLEAVAYAPPPVTQKDGEAAPPDATVFDYEGLNAYDDTDLGPIGGHTLTRLRTERTLDLPFADAEAEPEAEPEAPIGTLRPYRNTFTSFQVFPALRVDRYAAPRRSAVDAEQGRLGRELANTKVGFYATSREVLEGVSFISSVLVAPASRDAEDVADFFDPGRLLALDRDLFLQLDYRKGLPFVPRRWAPQFSLELYNLKRGVPDGLEIEESPCTACLPDTTYADLSYSLIEADLYARSKINRLLLLELGYRYSPYSVRTEPFFSREYGLTIPGSSDTYFRGRAVTLRAYFEAMRPSRSSDVIPEGLRAVVGYEYEPSELLDRFDVEDGRLVPVYEGFDLHRVTLDARYGRRLPGRIFGGPHGLAFRVKGSAIASGGEVDDFFNDYVGGLTGARGYPFYALGGTETLWLQAAYTFPIFAQVERQVGFLYVDKVYGRLFADAASAWTGAALDPGPFRKDVGGELRVGLSSFYLFPTALFASATYALDRFDLALPEGFLTPEGERFVTYGDEWQFHFGVLFEFDL